MKIIDVKKNPNIIYGSIAYILDTIGLEKCERTEIINIESKGALCKIYTAGTLVNFIKKNKKFKVVAYSRKNWIYCLSVYYNEEYHLAYLKKVKCKECGRYEDVLYPPMTIGPVEEVNFGFGEIKCLECGKKLDKHCIRIE
ncbi:hypothetical protein [Clostridium estertheticum]|uniref:Uncharacterized protein n=1 Tax=Clostridium estertheticum subsp. estertheticum TaxID=1552 RepID=A0A1J0GG76_9CLOT|nr:hypothetical protein [Clostridium estertheticum]APC40307.1 hypothetical protein A7L45_09625 [Clostridium estertheticum subsp. estertheticum]MBZ9617887.1 hypothetical protein [Clostridium estertheticum subsp. laramiense]WAG73548.1 hypothetical protein LL032_20900 [Clostridium estertheticum]